MVTSTVKPRMIHMPVWIHGHGRKMFPLSYGRKMFPLSLLDNVLRLV